MEKIRWGVIGSTGIAQKRTIPGMLLANNAECTAIMSTKQENVDTVGEKFGISRRYTTVESLLAQPDIDAVYIASPVHCHKEHVFAAADAGKHILLEKPMGLNPDEVVQMLEYCDARNIKLGVAFMMRFHGAHEEMKKIISSGRIGRVVSAHAIFNTNSVVVPGKWRQTKAYSGGGAMMDMGIHCIDLLQYLTGLKAETVTAICGNQIHRYPDVEDAGTVVMKMSNGAIFSVGANFNIPYQAGGSSFAVYGTMGSLTARMTLGQTEIGEVYCTSMNVPECRDVLIPYDDKNMYTKQIEAFSDAVLFDKPVPVSGEDGLLDQRIVAAAYESFEKGTHINLR